MVNITPTREGLSRELEGVVESFRVFAERMTEYTGVVLGNARVWERMEAVDATGAEQESMDMSLRVVVDSNTALEINTDDGRVMIGNDELDVNLAILEAVSEGGVAYRRPTPSFGEVLEMDGTKKQSILGMIAKKGYTNSRERGLPIFDTEDDAVASLETQLINSGEEIDLKPEQYYFINHKLFNPEAMAFGLLSPDLQEEIRAGRQLSPQEKVDLFLQIKETGRRAIMEEKK